MITDLQEKFSHLSRVVDDLSLIVARQDTEIEQLNKRVTMLMQREAGREAEAGGSEVFADQKPPHW